ncbi:MAG: PDZ domain-containing protein [Planctomycetota bacterium]
MRTRYQFVRMAFNFNLVAHLSLFAWTSLVALSCSTYWATIPTAVHADEPARPAAAIWQLVEQLDANQFASREDATERLVAAGGAAIEPLATAAAKGSLEVGLRAIHILRELALSGDVDSQEQARLALERLAAPRNSLVAVRSQTTLASLNETRQARAIDELQRLGVKLTSSHVQIGLQIMESVSAIEIGADWRGEVQDLRRLKFLNGIQSVKLIGPLVKDEWMPYLAHMENLQYLVLKKTEVTENGLAHIRNLNRIQLLAVLYSPVGDGAVNHLIGLKQLVQLRLFGTKITREAADKLTTELVTTKVDYRQGAFLGVNCQAHPLGCEVVLVQANTSAAAAGLHANDVLLKYNDQRVDSFEALTAQIAKNKPGDEVSVELVRDARMLRAPFLHQADEKLGATLKKHVLGSEITAVQPGQLADRLDLKPGDVIVGYSEERAADPDTLLGLLAKAKPNDQGALDYIRQPHLLVRKITLGEWD